MQVGCRDSGPALSRVSAYCPGHLLPVLPGVVVGLRGGWAVGELPSAGLGYRPCVVCAGPARSAARWRSLRSAKADQQRTGQVDSQVAILSSRFCSLLRVAVGVACWLFCPGRLVPAAIFCANHLVQNYSCRSFLDKVHTVTDLAMSVDIRLWGTSRGTITRRTSRTRPCRARGARRGRRAGRGLSID